MFEAKKAWEVLSKNGVTAPLCLEDLTRICVSIGSELVSYKSGEVLIQQLGQEQNTKYDAFTFRQDDTVIIFFRDELSTPDKLHAIAHEIGHIVLQHIYNGSLGFSTVEAPQEQEANLFAYELVIPSLVIRACGCQTDEDIKRICDVTNPCLGYHSKKLQYDIDDFTLEKSILAQYGGFIEDHCLKKGWFRSIKKGLRKHNPFPYIALVCCIAFAVVSWYGIFAPNHAAQPASVPKTTIQQTNETKPQTNLVYITPYGEKYHYASCRYAKQDNATPITLQEAQEMGRTPCKLCIGGDAQ